MHVYAHLRRPCLQRACRFPAPHVLARFPSSNSPRSPFLFAMETFFVTRMFSATDDAAKKKPAPEWLSRCRPGPGLCDCPTRSALGRRRLNRAACRQYLPGTPWLLFEPLAGRSQTMAVTAGVRLSGPPRQPPRPRPSPVTSHDSPSAASDVRRRRVAAVQAVV